jgi:hypothetical protein
MCEKEIILSELSDFINKTLENNDVKKYYSNGFVFTMGNSDILLIFQQNSIPLFSVNVSLTTAKTLALKLGKMITDLEEKIDNQIMTTEVLEQAVLSMRERNDT